MDTTEFVIEVNHLKKRFGLESGFFARGDRFVYAVNDVSFGIRRGGTYGIVGESGSGKTTTARLIVRMYHPDAGTVLYTGSNEPQVDVELLSARNLKIYREKVKYIFQDPSRSLNPRMTVFDILTSGFRASAAWPGYAAAREYAAHILEETGLDGADLDRRPSEFSGGQRQRISVARGLIMEPQVLICDEIVSALDVSIQGQILNLLQDIKAKRNLSLLFIAHDLKVSCYFCDTIGVMYRGFLVEEAPARDLYRTAVHPYTKLLFSGDSGELKVLTESLTGCPFAHRCTACSAQCRSTLPPWKITAAADGDHLVRCWNA